MSQTVYLCKVKINENIEHIFFYNEKPSSYFKLIKKHKKALKKRKPEEYSELAKGLYEGPLEIQSKTFDVITVRIITSPGIERIRNKIENKDYYYENTEYISGIDKSPKPKHLFGDISMYSILEQKKVETLKTFIDTTDDLITLKTVIGKSLFWFYTYNPKTIKYSDIIEKIKQDFKVHHEKGKFFILKKEKHYYSNVCSDVTLDNIKSEYFLNIASFKLKNLDTVWLKTKLEIDVDRKKLSNEDYIEELKNIYNSKDKKIFKTKYKDYSSCSKEGNGINSDEVILFSEEKRKIIDDYNKNLEMKYGKDINDLYISDLITINEDGDLENDNGDVYHIIKRGKKVLFKETLSINNVPFWIQIDYLYNDDEIK